MTECAERIEIGKTGRRRIVSTFDGGQLVSDGGASLLGIADRTLDLTERVAACLPDHRAPNRLAHSMVSLVRQRVFAIAMGYEDLNDHHALRDDAMLRLLSGRTPEDDELRAPIGRDADWSGAGPSGSRGLDAVVGCRRSRRRAIPVRRDVADVGQPVPPALASDDGGRALDERARSRAIGCGRVPR